VRYFILAFYSTRRIILQYGCRDVSYVAIWDRLHLYGGYKPMLSGEWAGTAVLTTCTSPISENSHWSRDFLL